MFICKVTAFLNIDSGLLYHFSLFPSEARAQLLEAIACMRDAIADPEKSQGRLGRDDKVAGWDQFLNRHINECVIYFMYDANLTDG